MGKVLTVRADRQGSSTDRFVAARKASSNIQKLDKGQEFEKNKPPFIGGGSSTTISEASKKTEEAGYEYVLSLAMKLPSSERKQLVAHLALDVQKVAVDGSERDLDMWVTALYDSIVQALGGDLREAPGRVLLKRSVASNSSWSRVRGFMDASGLSELTVIERQAAYRLVANLVVRYARSISSRRGVPMSAKFIAGLAGDVGQIFDASFPGYLASGLAKVVLRSHLQSS